jgi:hypothetical protein
MCFLEYYSDRGSVFSGGKRTPTRQWQNFFQEGQVLGSVDTKSTATYYYLAFDVYGFGSTGGADINDLTVNIAATADLIDITDEAMTADNLVIATLYIQTAGGDVFDVSSAQQITRYIGSLEESRISDIEISWRVNPAIDKMKPQVPTRKITSNMLNRANLKVP